MEYDTIDTTCSIGGVLAGIGGVVGFFVGWNEANVSGLEKLFDAGCNGCYTGAFAGAIVGYLIASSALRAEKRYQQEHSQGNPYIPGRKK